MPEIQKKIKADGILLDVDGTLWDSTELVARAWERAIAETGHPEIHITPDQLKNLFGRPMNVIAQALLPQLTEEERGRVMEKCVVYEHEILEENQKDISYAGVAETIRSLAKHFPVCIVSNCQSGYIELVCRKLGVEDCITDSSCYGDNGLYKADNIRLVADRNGYKAPVYVGDIQGDCDASREAGVAFIWAAYGFGRAEEPDGRIDVFPELLGILDGLGNL